MGIEEGTLMEYTHVYAPKAVKVVKVKMVKMNFGFGHLLTM